MHIDARDRSPPAPARRRRRATAAGAALALLAACAAPGPEPGAAPEGGVDARASAGGVRPGRVAAAPPAARDAAPVPGPRGPLPADPRAIAAAMRGVPIVLLGEVHDNPGQHALRAQALAERIAAGERFAIAFEQLDRERQADVDRARGERPRDADWLIARAGARGWDWSLYRPFVQLALDHDLPIVAANLSRTGASRVVRDGFAAAFDATALRTLGLNPVSPALLAAHEREVDAGHCGAIPVTMLAPMARAQIARDATLAAAIEPWARDGVVLLTGNGHVRRDLGVPRWLSSAWRERTLAIGFVERSPGEAAPAADGRYDAVVHTPPVERGDPCASFAPRGRPGGTSAR